MKTFKHISYGSQFLVLRRGLVLGRGINFWRRRLLGKLTSWNAMKSYMHKSFSKVKSASLVGTSAEIKLETDMNVERQAIAAFMSIVSLLL